MASARPQGNSTATVTVVATARAAVLSLANSFVPTMATHGSPRQLPRQFPRKMPWFHGHPQSLPRERDNHHGSPQTSAAIATAGFADIQPQQVPRISVAVRSRCHGNPPIRGDYHGKLAAIAAKRATVLSVAYSVVPTMPTEVRGNFHGSLRGNCVRKSGKTPQ